ncbi:MAG: SGNH/GDSL hydrolase family protein [Spirochaetes bacterium]|nr:SGNH/GDSL hydrolase family protein [Spirochaetota bacterium]
MKSNRISAAALLIIAAFTLTGAGKAEPFRDGDRVALIGDSITHGGSYHAVVYDFYITRFPGKSFRFYNCGISGDTASGANSRYDWDIAPREATAATIMLAMNDVNRGYYGVESPADDLLAKRKSAIDGHTNNMDRLINRLISNNVRVTVITPSPYDQTVAVKEKNLFGVNDALAYCGSVGRTFAEKYGLGVIDFNGPMTALNIEIQKTNSEATLIGRDRVHPGEPGHFLMAYWFLKDQGLDTPVAAAVIDAKAKKVLIQSNCTVTGVTVGDGSISFTYTALSLPLPVAGAYAAADALVPVTKDFNSERIAVSDLADGTYTMSCGGNAIGTYTSAELAAGINVATNAAWPDQQHALALHKMNWERLGAERMIRGIRQVEHGMRRANVDVSNDEVVMKYISDRIAQNATGGNAAYYRSVYSNYIAMHSKTDEFMAKTERLMDEMLATNRPRSVVIEIKPKQ